MPAFKMRGLAVPPAQAYAALVFADLAWSVTLDGDTLAFTARADGCPSRAVWPVFGPLVHWLDGERGVSVPWEEVRPYLLGPPAAPPAAPRWRYFMDFRDRAGTLRTLEVDAVDLGDAWRQARALCPRADWEALGGHKERLP